jgi:hypothetical protein
MKHVFICSELFDQADKDLEVLSSYYCMGHDAIFMIHIRDFNFQIRDLHRSKTFMQTVYHTVNKHLQTKKIFDDG